MFKVNFDKVFKMIDDLIAVLKEEQQADSHKKETCESQIDSTEDKAKDCRLSCGVASAEHNCPPFACSLTTHTPLFKGMEVHPHI